MKTKNLSNIFSFDEVKDTGNARAPKVLIAQNILPLSILILRQKAE